MLIKMIICKNRGIINKLKTGENCNFCGGFCDFGRGGILLLGCLGWLFVGLSLGIFGVCLFFLLVFFGAPAFLRPDGLYYFSYLALFPHFYKRSEGAFLAFMVFRLRSVWGAVLILEV